MLILIHRACDLFNLLFFKKEGKRKVCEFRYRIRQNYYEIPIKSIFQVLKYNQSKHRYYTKSCILLEKQVIT